MALTQGQAEATPYFWTFNTLTQKNNVVTARRRQRGQFVEFLGTNVAAALSKVNSYETYMSNMSVSVTQF